MNRAWVGLVSWLCLAPGCIDFQMCGSDSECPEGQVCGANNLCFEPLTALDAGEAQAERALDEGEPADETPSAERDGNDADESAQSAQNAKPLVCTDSETGEVKDALNQYEPIAIPDDCEADIQGELVVRPEEGALFEGDPSSLRVSFENGAITAIEGIPCVAAAPGKIMGSAWEVSCKQYFICDCCAISLQKAGLWQVESGGGYSGDSCTEKLRFSSDYVVPWTPEDYEGEGTGEGTGTGQTTPPPANNACGDCLAGCSGSPFCCTSIGCNCYEECYTPPAFTPNIECDPDIQICN